MEIKAGYKQTDVGIIPQDWEVKIVGDLFSVSGGFSSSRSQLSNEGYCYLHYGDIHGSEKQYTDVEKEYLSIPKLNIDLRRISQASLLEDGDIVFVDASEDDEGASKHIVIHNPNAIQFISGLHTIVLKSKDDSIIKRYKEYCFLTHSIRQQFKYYAVGTKVTGISKTNIKNIKVILPPKQAEQSAIAEALSDTDSLIASLERLITKKRNVKQGAIQLLLTGKKRLPGFAGNWQETELQRLCSSINDGTHRTPRYVDEGIPFYSVENVIANNFSKTKFITLEEHNELIKRCNPQKGDILLTRIGTLGATKLIDWDANASIYVSLALLKINNQIDNRFLYWYTKTSEFLRGLRRDALLNAIPPKINMGAIGKVTIRFPKYKEEQTAIVQVLSDMDEEIEQLEHKLAKYMLIKQGMIQELLTGKKRLV